MGIKIKYCLINPKKLKSLIKKQQKIIAIYGLGNVGGAIASVWLRFGAKVIGVDISKNLLSKIKSGNSHKKEPFVSKTFQNALHKKYLILTSDGIKASKLSHIKIIAVPVGLKRKNVDLNSVKKVGKNIAYGLKKGDIVILSPSVPPNTCHSVLLPILEKYSKLKVEKDFYLIYNPERIFEGRAIKDIEENYPAIVSGYGKKSLQLGDALLKLVSKKGVILVSSIQTAEAEKLFEGVYRDVNIALANELADYCERMGIDFWESRKSANSQPFCHLHYPGTGVGGFCIPVYPQIVIESAKKVRKNMKLLEFSRTLNNFMPKKCVNDAIGLLPKNRKNTKVAILGLGFRGDVTDSRLSPSYVVINEFLKKGFSVKVHDPYIFEDKKLPKSVILSHKIKDVIKNADLIFISTDHKQYAKLNNKSFNIAKKPLTIFDGRNILNKNNFKNSILATIGSK